MDYAHSTNAEGRAQPLIEHLTNVAAMASDFARPFGGADLASVLGLWHDLGKFHPAFQAYLAECEANPAARGRGPDHKAAGAWLAARHAGPTALIVQGHHGGLCAPTELQAWLAERLKSPAANEALERARRALPGLEPGDALQFPPHVESDAVGAELFLRLLFSALVDADYLDTERHFRSERAEQRRADVTIAELWERFERNQRAVSGHRSDPVGRARHAVYEHCLAAADEPTGLFRLTVPTGGGKTRSAMAFALRHAMRHGLRRVIVAVPFISITEQTAQEYRRIFADTDDDRPVVLEHHSAVAEPIAEEQEDFHPSRVWARLAAENWDAPIVVTTTVQLFESLFANGTSRSRKLHRLARSVIILDEAQALPPPLLTPILEVLGQLCRHYGTTVVLSTATQPAFESIPVFASIPAREIVPEPDRYFRLLRRVTYDWLTAEPMSWADVADLVRGEPQALAVVNTKADALALLDALDDPEALHLSTLLCGAHRRAVISEVKRRLEAGAPCRLIATQVIEAGVDLDFPLVLRALGPLDAIVQAAGRCNREGRLDRGRVIVFRPAEGSLPKGFYRTATGVAGAVLGRGRFDADDPAALREYFRQVFDSVDLDREQIQRLRERLNYPEVARRFRMIDETENVAVTRYGTEEERVAVRRLLEELRGGVPNARLLLRRLQPYLVSVPSYQAERYRTQGLILPVLTGLGEWCGDYEATRGIVAEIPETMIV